MTIELTPEEAAFLSAVLESIQLAGTPDQVRHALAMVDAISEKLKERKIG